MIVCKLGDHQSIQKLVKKLHFSNVSACSSISFIGLISLNITICMYFKTMLSILSGVLCVASISNLGLIQL